MRKKLIILISLSVLVLAALSVYILGGLDAKDACLDQGGSYHSATGQCEK